MTIVIVLILIVMIAMYDKFIATLLAVILLLIALNSCKVHRDVQQQSSRVDSTAVTSKEVAKGSAFLQQFQNKRLDSSHTSGQNKYQKQTVNFQFAPDTGRNKSNVTGLLPSALEQRLTGMTVTTEQGTQDVQTGSLTRQNTDLLNIGKDSIKSGEKKSLAVKKEEAAKHTAVTRRFGSSLWLIILLLIAVAVVIIWIRKGNPIAVIIGWLRKAKKQDTPAA